MNNLLKVTWLISGSALIWTQGFWFRFLIAIKDCGFFVFSWMCYVYSGLLTPCLPRKLGIWAAVKSWALRLPRFFSLICSLSAASCWNWALCYLRQRRHCAEFLKPYYNLIVDWWRLTFSSLDLIANSLGKKQKTKHFFTRQGFS